MLKLPHGGQWWPYKRKGPGARAIGVATFHVFCSQNIEISKKKSSFLISVQNFHFRPKNSVIFKKKFITFNQIHYPCFRPKVKVQTRGHHHKEQYFA